MNTCLRPILLGAIGLLPACATQSLQPIADLYTNAGAATVYDLDVDDSESSARLASSLAEARAQGKQVYLSIRVGRSPRFAAAHPEWLAGIGSHEDWRAHFPAAPRPETDERIVLYPWASIWYRDALENRRAAIAHLVRGGQGAIRGVFLHDVQGAPAACGCGNDQCRWTVDYRLDGGPRKADSAPAALLVAALAAELPSIEWIPVLVPECGEKDSPGEGSTGRCGGVSCFQGLCWKESSRELDDLLRQTSRPIAILVDSRSLERPKGVEAERAWLIEALDALEKVPQRLGRAGLPRERIILVASEDDRALAERTAELSGPGARRLAGWLVPRTALDESWEPRLAAKRSASPRPAPEAHAGHE